MNKILKLCLTLVISFMTISTAGASLTTYTKDWLAINAGSNNCFATAGISYEDPDGIMRIGSTGDVLNAFFVAHLIGKDTTIIIENTDYFQLKTINGETDLGIDDIGLVYNNDGSPSGETQYCASLPVPPVPELNIGILTSIGLFGLFVVSRRYKR